MKFSVRYPILFLGLALSFVSIEALAVCNPPPNAATPGRPVNDDSNAVSAANRRRMDPNLTCFDTAYPSNNGQCAGDGGIWKHALGDNGMCYSMYPSDALSVVVDQVCNPPENASVAGTIAAANSHAIIAAQSRGLDPRNTCFDKIYYPGQGASCADDGGYWRHGKDENGWCFPMYTASPAGTPVSNPIGAASAASIASSPSTGSAAGLGTNGPSSIQKISGTTKKICQLIGDWDSERNQPTLNQSGSKYGVTGTDLGVSFEHNGKLIFLWGDTTNSEASGNLHDADNASVSYDNNPDDCLQMDWHSNGRGGFMPLAVPGVSMGTMGVPTGGFSLNGVAYAFVSNANNNIMTASHLARSYDDGRTWDQMFQVSFKKFINISPHVTDTALWGGQLPDSSGAGIILIGSGVYRNSDVYMAYMSQSLDKNSLRYYAGMENGRVKWSVNEDDAIQLFTQPFKKDGGVGELSFQWIPQMKKWVVLYNHESPFGINMRTADSPWGPWSDNQLIFNPEQDGARGTYMNAGGGPYGPFMIPKFTKQIDSHRVRLYWVLSVWDPYTTELMTTDFYVP